MRAKLLLILLTGACDPAVVIGQADSGSAGGSVNTGGSGGGTVGSAGGSAFSGGASGGESTIDGGRGGTAGLGIVSCDSDGGIATADAGFSVDLSGAMALALPRDPSHYQLFKLDSAGQVSSALRGVGAYGFATLRNKAVLASLSIPGCPDTYLIESCGALLTKLENCTSWFSQFGTFRGQNSQGDLVFHNAAVFRAQSRTIAALAPFTVGRTNVISAMSGDFAVGEVPGGVVKIANTLDGTNYNINASEYVLALSSTRPLVGPCPWPVQSRDRKQHPTRVS